MNAAPSALREMVKTNARELFRDGKTAFFTVLFPLLFLAMFLGLGALTAGGSYRIAVVDSPEQPAIVSALVQVDGFHVEPWKGAQPLPAGDLGVTTRSSPSPADRRRWSSTRRGSAH